jgi:hypothetical protein
MPATIKNRKQKVPQKVVSICHSVGYLSPGIGPGSADGEVQKLGYMLKNIDNQATNGEEKSKPEVIGPARQAGHGVSSTGRFNTQACTAVGSMEATG